MRCILTMSCVGQEQFFEKNIPNRRCLIVDDIRVDNTRHAEKENAVRPGYPAGRCGLAELLARWQCYSRARLDEGNVLAGRIEQIEPRG